jgi:hypothetical protein
MKKLMKIFVLMMIVSIAVSCAPKKHGCNGIKSHPNYNKKW